MTIINTVNAFNYTIKETFAILNTLKVYKRSCNLGNCPVAFNCPATERKRIEEQLSSTQREISLSAGPFIKLQE